MTVEAVDNWAAVDNLPVRRAVPPGYVVVLDDDEGLGVELDELVELDDAVASSLDPLLVLDPSVSLFDDLGLVSFVPLLCALLSVR